MKYKIYNVATTFSGASGLKVVAVEEVGFPYCIGSIGAQVVGDSGNEYGYATGAKTTKYTIEVE